MRKGRFSEEQIINVKGGPAAAQLHLIPRRNRFRQRPVQVRTRLSAGGKWIRTLGPAGKTYLVLESICCKAGADRRCLQDRPFRLCRQA
jgi:hypothetical protein